jgi:DNA-binding response OmpR family regulator
MRVLIVEDEKSLAAEIQEFLLKEQFCVDLAYSSKHASELLSENPYDIILLDLGLPDGDGMDLIDDSGCLMPKHRSL